MQPEPGLHASRSHRRMRSGGTRVTPVGGSSTRSLRHPPRTHTAVALRAQQPQRGHSAAESHPASALPSSQSLGAGGHSHHKHSGSHRTPSAATPHHHHHKHSGGHRTPSAATPHHHHHKHSGSHRTPSAATPHHHHHHHHHGSHTRGRTAGATRTPTRHARSPVAPRRAAASNPAAHTPASSSVRHGPRPGGGGGVGGGAGIAGAGVGRSALPRRVPNKEDLVRLGSSVKQAIQSTKSFRGLRTDGLDEDTAAVDQQVLHQDLKRQPSAWEPPDVAAARRHAKNVVFLEGNASVCGYRMGDMKALGPGIHLYFWMLRGLAITLGVMTLLMVPLMKLGHAGRRISNDNMDLFSLASVSLGNVGFRQESTCGPLEAFNVTHAFHAQCAMADRVPASATSTIHARQAALYVSCGDIAAVAAFLGFVMAYKLKLWLLNKEFGSHDKVSNASSYAVYVRNLPSDATEDELRAFFSNNFPLDQPDWSFTGWCGCIGRKLARPPFRDFHRYVPYDADAEEDLLHSDSDEEYERAKAMKYRYLPKVGDVSVNGNAGYYDSWVADVSMVHTSSVDLELYHRLQAVLMVVENAKARVDRFSSGADADPQRKRTAQRSLNTLTSKLKRLLRKLTSENTAAGRRATMVRVHRASLVRAASTASSLSLRSDAKPTEHLDGLSPHSVSPVRPGETGHDRGHDRAHAGNSASFRHHPGRPPRTNAPAMPRTGTWTTGKTAPRHLPPPPPAPQAAQPARMAGWDLVRYAVRTGGVAALVEPSRRQDMIRALRARELYSFTNAVFNAPKRFPNQQGGCHRSDSHRGDAPLRLNRQSVIGPKLGKPMRAAVPGVIRDEACGAFVVFQHEESRERAVADYASSHSWCLRLLQPPPLRFHGRRLIVTEAPDPSAVLWHNLHTSHMSQRLRRAGTMLVSLVLLFLSFLAMYYAQRSRRIFQLQQHPAEVCGVDIPSAMVGMDRPLSVDEAVSPELYSDPSRTQRCTTGCQPAGFRCPLPNQHFIAFKESDPANDGTVLGSATYNVGEQDPCASPCVSRGDDTVCQSLLGDAFNYRASARVGCFCTQQLRSLVAKHGPLTGGFTFINQQLPMCSEFADSYVLGQGLRVMSAVVIVTVNLLLQFIMRALVRYERHHSVSKRDMALTWKLFVSEFLNTGLLAIIMFGSFPYYVELPFGITLFKGEFTGLPPEWYAVVGSYLTLTSLFNALSPALHLFLTSCVKPIYRRLTLHRIVTQKAMNDSFTGPTFDLPLHLSGVLNVSFVAIIFAAGMPVLLPIAAGSFVLMYWVEKYAVLRVYRKPPHYDLTLGRSVVAVLPYAALLNLLFTTWALSDETTLASDQINVNSSGSPRGESPANTLYAHMLRLFHVESLGDATTSALRREAVAPVALAVAVATVALILYEVVATARGCYHSCRRAVGKSDDSGGRVGRHKRCHRPCLDMQKLCGLSSKRATANIRFAPGFTDVYAQWLGQFWGASPEGLSMGVNAEDQQHGWQLKLGNDGYLWLAKAWTEDGVTDGVKHKRGQLKKTWEVLRDEGLHSYRIENTSMYKEAVQAREYVDTVCARDDEKPLTAKANVVTPIW